MLKGYVCHVCMIVALLLIGGCAGGGGNPHSQNQMAAEYCRSVGGENEISESSLGTGHYCRLPTGRVINAWQFYQSERLDLN